MHYESCMHPFGIYADVTVSLLKYLLIQYPIFYGPLFSGTFKSNTDPCVHLIS